MDWAKWKDLAQILSSFATAVGVIGTITGVIAALCIYRRNSRLERAKWITSLYEKFFENGDLKKVRNSLDVLPNSAEVAKVERVVSEERAEFTDYLNFFEYVAILRESKQLRDQEVYDLFGYYLECLKRHAIVQAYIDNEAKAYEKLRKLLTPDQSTFFAWRWFKGSEKLRSLLRSKNE